MTRQPSPHLGAVKLVEDLLAHALDVDSDRQMLDLLHELERRLGPLDPETTGRIQQSASRLRHQVTASRWRESQLQSMLDTAQELMARDVPEQLLDVVIHATRRLVPSDIAHINLGRPDGDFIDGVRASEGEVTPAWRRYRSRRGIGVTGRVFATNAPFVAVDYATEPNMLHSDEADEAALSDGVHTMAGVPLRHGDEVVGALIASWRSRQTISAEQLSTMITLASLASVALASSRVHEEHRGALRQLEKAHTELQETNKTLEWGSAFHDQLTQLILGGADLSLVAERVADALGRRIAILDDLREVLATTDSEFPRWTSARREPTEPIAGEIASADGPCWISTATSGGSRLASVLVDSVDLNDIEKRTLDRVAIASALLLTNARAVFETHARDQSNTVTELVSGGQLTGRAEAHARSIGLEPLDGAVLMVLDHPDGSDRLLGALHTYAQTMNGVAGYPQGHAVLIVPGTDPAAAGRRAQSYLERRSGRTFIGAYGPVREVEEFEAAFQHARTCCSAAQRLSPPGGVATPETLGFVGLLLGDSGRDRIREFVDRTIGALIDYDQRHSSALCTTLSNYFRQDSSLKGTAAALHIHPNTVHQRIKRAEVLLGADLRRPETVLEIQLALRLHEFASSTIAHPA